ncbi:DUF2075 domain-containing protein [Enterococcus entomosocium]|uniref:DUF2075 domain-containing protein n=1 Tax=Enterococcus entomosocium TaxID=3034352 RepID=UPI003B5A1B2C
MAKYEYIMLEVDGKELVGFDKLRKVQQGKLEKGDIIYIYRSTKSNKVYIGQSKHFKTRHEQHYNGSEEKFNEANFKQVIVLFSALFNGSALNDVENQLITYFLTDSSKSRRNMVEYESSEVINLTKGNNSNSYKEREAIATEVVLPFWEELYRKGWVKTSTIDKLRNQALVKYSPIKELTKQQMNLIDEILENSQKNYVINGDAGTGKTVLLTHLVAKFLDEQPDKSITVVVQPNWIKTAQEIFNVYGMCGDKLTVATSTQIINRDKDFDVVVVDESHKLSRKYAKQMASFNNVYKGRFYSDDNHLEPLKKIGKQVILMYDVLQAIRPANITREQFSRVTEDFEKKYLTTQFRIQAPEGKSYTSDDYINGIKYLLYKDTDLLSETNYDPNFDRSVFHDGDIDAYFGFFEDKPLANLFDWIEDDRNYNNDHINRVLGGLVEPWKQSDGKNPEITHWHEGNLYKRWNSTQENWINSKDLDAEDQVGSVFAVQGIDLNKVGVLIGNDLQVDEAGHLFGNPNNFHNINGKFSKNDTNPKNANEFTLFVLNIYYILLTRGIDGVRIGFWKNDSLIRYMKKVLLAD